MLALQILASMTKFVKLNRAVYLRDPPRAASFCGSMVAQAAQRLLDEELHLTAAARDIAEMAVAE